MLRKLALGLVLLPAIGGMAYAQQTEDCKGLDPNAWRFEEFSAEIADQARVKNAYYTDLFKSDRFQESAVPLHWLYVNTPGLNPSIYINGAKIYQALGEQASDEAQSMVYYDSVIWTYQERARLYCDTDGDLINRQAYLSFRFFYRDRSRHQPMYELFKEARRKTGDAFLAVNLEYYLQLSAWLTKAKKISDDELLAVYDDLTGHLALLVKQGRVDAESATKLQDKMDAIIITLFEVDKAFIEERFCSIFKPEDNNTALAKRIISFSLAAKATDNACFLGAAQVAFTAEPTPAMARLIGDRLSDQGKADEALSYYEQALPLMESNIKKSELYYAMALIERKRGRLQAARSFSLKGLEQDPTNTNHMLMIGDLYQAAYEGCKGGTNVVHDRAVFIAAYNWYKKANDANRMSIAKAQFPSNEEIFSYNMKKGDTYTITCWVGETVTIQSRD